MPIQNFRYCKGGQNSNEAVEFDIHRADGAYKTTCVVNVDLLLCKIWTHPCGNGDDLELAPELRLKVLEFVQKEREKITSSYPIKTRQAWHDSGLSKFEDFCFPGDEVDSEMVEHFVNSVPPIKTSPNCTQEGEAHSSEFEPRCGRYRETYATFHSIGGGRWIFDGYCFYGENTNRYTYPTRIEQLITEISEKVKNRERLFPEN